MQLLIKSEINTKPTCSQSEIRVRCPSLLKSLKLLGRHVDYAVTSRTSGCPHWLDSSSLSDCVAGVDFHSSECHFGGALQPECISCLLAAFVVCTFHITMDTDHVCLGSSCQPCSDVQLQLLELTHTKWLIVFFAVKVKWNFVVHAKRTLGSEALLNSFYISALDED